MQRTRKLLLPLLALILATLACGGSDPVSLDELALYPGVTAVEQGDLFADSIAESFRAGAGDEGVDSEVGTYHLPEGTGWADVKAFYDQQAGAGDWEAAEEMLEETEFVSTAGWTRGGLASEQALVIAYSVNPLGGQPYLILAIFSE